MDGASFVEWGIGDLEIWDLEFDLICRVDRVAVGGVDG